MAKVTLEDITISNADADVHLMDWVPTRCSKIGIGSSRLWEQQDPFWYVLKTVKFRGTQRGLYISDKTTKWETDDHHKMFIVGRDDYWYACEGVIAEGLAGEVGDVRIDRACFRIGKDELALESEGVFEWTLSNRTDDDLRAETKPWYDSQWWVSTMLAETRFLPIQGESDPAGGA